MRKAVIYLRVSTIEQTTANQERELREIASRMGCEIVKVYRDHGISGAKGRDRRPAFDKLCRDAARREFDMVMAWSVDRLGRSLQDLVGFLSELHALKIDLFLRQQGLDTTTPAGKAMFQMMGVFAEFERAMIQERVRAGLARAKSEGKRLGRPPIAPALEKRIREALATPGRPGIRVIAEWFGVNPSTVQRINRPFDAMSDKSAVAEGRVTGRPPLGSSTGKLRLHFVARQEPLLPREQRLSALEGILSLLVNGNDSRARPAKESTMTSKTQNAENSPLDDHELELVRGGFTLIELLVQEPNQISIIMGMQLPAVHKVR